MKKIYLIIFTCLLFPKAWALDLYLDEGKPNVTPMSSKSGNYTVEVRLNELPGSKLSKKISPVIHENVKIESRVYDYVIVAEENSYIEFVFSLKNYGEQYTEGCQISIYDESKGKSISELYFLPHLSLDETMPQERDLETTIWSYSEDLKGILVKNGAAPDDKSHPSTVL